MKDYIDGDVNPSWDRSMRHDRPVPSLATFLPVYVERAYELSTEEQFLSTHCHYHSVLRHTGSHHIIIVIISNIISLLHLTPRKSKLTLFSPSLCLF
jgi:hypothetical protein